MGILRLVSWCKLVFFMKLIKIRKNLWYFEKKRKSIFGFFKSYSIRYMNNLVSNYIGSNVI